MEIVSRLLGNSNMNITQAHYGKVLQRKVSAEMKKIFSILVENNCSTSLEKWSNYYEKENPRGLS